jgi:hypothetical protein
VLIDLERKTKSKINYYQLKNIEGYNGTTVKRKTAPPSAETLSGESFTSKGSLMQAEIHHRSHYESF